MNALLPAAILVLSLACAPEPAAADTPLPQRYLWTWDHRMDWAGVTVGGSVMGGGGRYHKPAEEYLADYKALIDYMHEHTSFNAIIIWGFLRDSHGGVAAAQELCRYANSRSIRIVPGVGTSGYEGYYFEGDHKYNVTTWLRQHPELRSVGEDGKPRNALCPSQPENVQWLKDGCRWLFETFDIGGINFEIGDFFVCHCDRCRSARAAIPGDAPDYYKDVAISTAPVARLAGEISPDAWLSYATYTGFTPQMAESAPAWVDLIPPEIICQWTLTGMTGAQTWPDGLRPPTRRNTGYLHWGNKSTASVDGFFTQHIRDVCRRAWQAGFVGLATYGEDPPSHLTMKLFYHAWSYFLDHPQGSLRQYAEGPLASWFGSADEAERFLGIACTLEEQGVTRAALPATIERAEAGLAEAGSEAARDTWGQFVSFLRAKLQAIEAADRVLSDPEAVAAAMAGGFEVPQETRVTLLVGRGEAGTLELRARVHYSVENGLLPVLRVTLNGTVLGPERAVDRPLQIATPHHDGYQSLPAFDTDRGAWRVKYAPSFEVSRDTGGKYDTPDYSPVFCFTVGDLWRDGDNRLQVENLEGRFRDSGYGVLQVGGIVLR